MATDEFGEKTEQPTDRRRTDARQKGNVPRSVDLNTAGHMLAAALVIFAFGTSLAQYLARYLQTSISAAGVPEIDPASATTRFWEIGSSVAAHVLPVALALMAAALMLNLAQVGFLVAPEALQPKWARINPIQGAKRIVSLPALVRLGTSLGKLVVVALLAGWTILSLIPHFLGLVEAEPQHILLTIHDAAVRLAFQLALALFFLAVLDFAFQRWKHEQDLRMTKQEVREELKQMEGDPMIRQRRRDAHRKLAEARELQQVPTADVIITNPTEIAVALKYDPERMPAPTVVAKGMGEVAARIRRIASEHHIPIIERKALARALYRDVRVGQPIPVELYEVFVEIMAYVYRLTGRTPPNIV